MFGIFNKTQHEKPLTIVVTETEWEAYGNPHSLYHTHLYNLLVKEGGISKSVPAGTYHYSGRRKNMFQLITKLEPAPEE